MCLKPLIALDCRINILSLYKQSTNLANRFPIFGNGSNTKTKPIIT